MQLGIVNSVDHGLKPSLLNQVIHYVHITDILSHEKCT